MPTFDLRGIRCAKYVNTDGAVSYTDHTSIGDAMNVNLELKYAEGRLYAESKLAEYKKLATGGTISVGVKYVPDAAKRIMYGCTEKTRLVSSASVKGNLYSANDIGGYVGVAFYSPDVIDGADKYSCMFIPKVLFGPPGYSYQTKGENLQFNTPTTTGEFLPDDSTGKVLMEEAICNTEAEAIAWTKAVLGET